MIHKRTRLLEIQDISSSADFWRDAVAARNLLKEKARLESSLTDYENLQRSVDDAEAMWELSSESDDSDLAAEARILVAQARDSLKKAELSLMLGGLHDRDGALISINAGAGGTDAQDWAEMLCRMYLRWAERRQLSTEILDHLPGEEAGIKSTLVAVSGEYAYGYLSGEAGVHRLVRISPFDANKRRQTSFAAVHVVPDIDQDVEVEIDERDLKIDCYRAGGAGGQHVNKTESAVRITHLPTNIVVTCQNERSQHKNKSHALRVLRAKVYDLKLRQRKEELEHIGAEKKSIEWGSQIRSYVLAPYRLVNDHRTDLKASKVDSVLDGDIDGFMEAFLLLAKKRE